MENSSLHPRVENILSLLKDQSIFQDHFEHHNPHFTCVIGATNGQKRFGCTFVELLYIFKNADNDHVPNKCDKPHTW